MSTALVFTLPGQESAAGDFARHAGFRRGASEIRAFPDGETYVRVTAPCAGVDAVIYATLDRPDRKIMPLLLLAATLRDLGANRVALVAPYLPYLRQDRSFHDGEGVTSRHFAAILSAHFDFLLTLEPHLHRYPALDAVYSIPAQALHADALLAQWIGGNIEAPLLVGPDRESEPWVAAVARHLGAPFVVFDKVRHGDRDVELRLPAGLAPAGRMPVLVDDILSTGHTLAAAALALRERGFPAPACAAVHALFCGDAEEVLRGAGIDRIATVNTVIHRTNAMNAHPPLAAALARWLASSRKVGAKTALA